MFSEEVESSEYNQRDYDECLVCLSTDLSSANPIVWCVNCKKSWHTSCYDGVKRHAQVLCQVCSAGLDKQEPKCELCPNVGNHMLEKTTDGRWVHTKCVFFMPEIKAKEGSIAKLDAIDQTRLQRVCFICDLVDPNNHAKMSGACVKCDHLDCENWLHITCAMKSMLDFSIRQYKCTQHLESETSYDRASTTTPLCVQTEPRLNVRVDRNSHLYMLTIRFSNSSNQPVWIPSDYDPWVNRLKVTREWRKRAPREVVSSLEYELGKPKLTSQSIAFTRLIQPGCEHVYLYMLSSIYNFFKPAKYVVYVPLKIKLDEHTESSIRATTAFSNLPRVIIISSNIE